MRTIVISAVNIRKGGTLTILRSCLKYLSMSYKEQGYRVLALVHKREVADYPGIEYIEFPQTWPENSFVIKHTSKDVIYDVTEFSITGSVFDNNDRPVEGAKVSVCSQDGTEITSTYTNSEGLYTIINTELDGEYQLKVEKAGFTSVSQDAVLNSDNIMGALYDFHLNAAKFIVNTVEGAAITYQSTSPNTVKVVSGPGAGYSGALTIPNKVNCDGVEYTVTGIGAYVFIYYEKLTIC